MAYSCSSCATSLGLSAMSRMSCVLNLPRKLALGFRPEAAIVSTTTSAIFGLVGDAGPAAVPAAADAAAHPLLPAPAAAVALEGLALLAGACSGPLSVRPLSVRGTAFPMRLAVFCFARAEGGLMGDFGDKFAFKPPAPEDDEAGVTTMGATPLAFAGVATPAIEGDALALLLVAFLAAACAALRASNSTEIWSKAPCNSLCRGFSVPSRRTRHRLRQRRMPLRNAGTCRSMYC